MGPLRRFTDRTAIVTGASRGIGAALAERLAAEGAEVVLVARTAEQHPHLAGSLLETVDRCRRHGAVAHALVADLADADDRARIVPDALDLLGGRLDILVNNAAAAMYGPSAAVPAKRRRILFEVNVHAPIDLMQAAVPTLVERGEGWIVNVSSATARPAAGPPFDAGSLAAGTGTYGASKAALNRITNAFGAELHGSGVRVNAVEPRAAVMSEGSEAILGGSLAEDKIEAMEAMVEAIAHLCACGPERTGRAEVSLDLLDELGLVVLGLDATTPHPGGQRRNPA